MSAQRQNPVQNSPLDGGDDSKSRSQTLTVEDLQDPTVSLRNLRRAQLSDDPQVRKVASDMLQQRLRARRQQQPLHLAADPATPDEVLIRLAGHPSAAVRQRALNNNKIPRAFLEILKQLLDGQPLDESALVALAKSGPWVQRKVLERTTGEAVFAAVAANGGAELVARHPKAPPAILAQLAWQAAVQKLIAVHPNTPQDVLLKFARNQNSSLRAWVARNPALDARSMAKLATDPDWEVREALATNPELTEEAIRLLAENNWNEEIGLSLVEQRRIPPDILAQMAEWPNVRLRRRLARHFKTPPEVLVRFASEADPLVRLEVAAHFATPAEVRNKLSQDAHPLVRLAAMGGDLQHKNPAVRRAALLSPNLREEEVAKAVHDPDLLVKRLAAAHPLCSQQGREHMLQIIPGLRSDLVQLYGVLIEAAERDYDRNALVELRILAASSQTPPRILKRLYQHGHPFLLEALVRNSRTPPEVLQDLAQDLDYREILERRHNLAIEVRRRIEALDALEATRPLDPRRLKRFLGSTSEAVRLALVSNTDLPPHAKQTLVSDSSAKVRAALAARDDITSELLEILALDRDPDVVRSVLARQELAPSVLEALARSSLPEAWERVLSDANTSEGALEHLLPYRQLWLALSNHPRSSAALLETLYQQAGYALRGAIVQHPNASARLLRRIAGSLMGLRWRLLYWLPFNLESLKREQANLLKAIHLHNNCPHKLRAKIEWWLNEVLENPL